MSYFRKKPVVIEAMKFTGRNHDAILQFTGAEAADYVGDDFSIHTLEGTMKASKGDWIIKGVKGEFYPCKPDIFAATYELASAPSSDWQDARRLWNLCDRAMKMLWLAIPETREPVSEASHNPITAWVSEANRVLNETIVHKGEDK